MRKNRFLSIALVSLLLCSCAGASSDTPTTDTDTTTGTSAPEPSTAPHELPPGPEAPSGTPGENDRPPEGGPSTNNLVAALPEGLEAPVDAESLREDITDAFQVNTSVPNGYTLENGTCTITQAGEYLLSGALDGHIVVNVEDKGDVELMLAGAKIISDAAAPIAISKAGDVTITVKDSTFNEIIDARTGDPDAEDAKQTAAIFSKSDLKLKGQGALVISAAYNNGIACKKDLSIKNGILSITAQNNALKGDDTVTVAGGDITLVAKTGSGIRTKNADVTEKGKQNGVVSITGGALSINAANDGIHAATNLVIDDGRILIAHSQEGLEGQFVTINGGSTYVVASDDGVNASDPASGTNCSVTVNGGYLDVITGGGDTDGIDSNGDYMQTGGVVLVKGGSSAGRVSGSIDVNGSIQVTGGSTFAFGGICEIPTDSCNGYVLSGQTLSAGTYTLTVNGQAAGSFVLPATFSTGWICSDALTASADAELSCDGTSVATWTQESGMMGSENIPGGFGGGMGHDMGGMEHGNKGERPEGDFPGDGPHPDRKNKDRFEGGMI